MNFKAGSGENAHITGKPWVRLAGRGGQRRARASSDRQHRACEGRGLTTDSTRSKKIKGYFQQLMPVILTT